MASKALQEQRSTSLVRRARSTDPVVEEAILEVGRIWESGVRDTVVRLGQYLIKTFYGSLEAARSLQPSKPASLARLLARADELPVSGHALRTAVRVALVARELPREAALELTVSHYEQLATVRDPAARLQLAEEAVSRRLTVQQLSAQVRRSQPPHPGGRARKHPLERGVGAVVRALSSPDIAAGLASDGLRSLDRAQVERIEADLRRAREIVGQIQDALARKTRR